MVGLVVDLAAADAERLPAREAETTVSQASACRGLLSQPAPTPCQLVLALLKTAGTSGRLTRAVTALRPAPPDPLRKINDNGPRIAIAEIGPSEPSFGPVFPQCSRAPI